MTHAETGMAASAGHGAQGAAMDADAQSVREDLAYLRGLVDGGGRPPENFGKAMLSGGLIHGALLLVYLFHFAGIVVLPPVAALHIVLPFAPSLIWLAYLAAIRRNGRSRALTGAHKAIAAAFQSVGLVSLATLPPAALIALRTGELAFVFIHSMAVLAMLGAAWFIAWRLTARAWALWAAVGWLASAALMGAAIAYASLTGVFAVGAFVFLALMALPGWVLLRQARAAA